MTNSAAPVGVRRPARRRASILTLAGAALLTLLTAGCGPDPDCCAPRPEDHGLPQPHGPGTDIDYPSQELRLRPRTGMDFSVFVRLDERTPADWSVADRGDEGDVLRYARTKTVDGSPDGGPGASPGARTRYFVFHAEKPGEAEVVLEDRRSGRTMTYAVDVVRTAPGAPRTPAGSARPVESGAVEGRKAAGKFEGTITVGRGETFAVANPYSNVPGITWHLSNSDPAVASVASEREEPTTTGDPAGARQDWYTFTAAEKGTTTVKLSGCYRCTYRTAAKSAESRKFSETRTLTIRVR